MNSDIFDCLTMREIVLSKPMHHSPLLNVGSRRDIDDNVSQLLPVAIVQTTSEFNGAKFDGILPDDIHRTRSHFRIVVTDGET